MFTNMVTVRDINEYLYWEFGFDGDADEAHIADDWPFELQPTEAAEVHAFTHEGESYYAISRGALNYLPTAGMSVADVRLQIAGEQWIRARDPVGLNTSRLGDERVPPLPTRRTALEQLAIQVLGAAVPFRLLEGLFLAHTREYIGLVERTDTRLAYLVGSQVRPGPVRFELAPPWRRLAATVGERLAAGDTGKA